MKEEKDQEAEPKTVGEVGQRAKNTQYPLYSREEAYPNEYGPEDLLKDGGKEDENIKEEPNEENQEDDNIQEVAKDDINEELPNLAATESLNKQTEADNESLGFNQEIQLLNEQGENDYALQEENKEGTYEDPIDNLMEDPIGSSEENRKNINDTSENHCFMSNEGYSSQAFEAGNKQEYDKVDVNQTEEVEPNSYAGDMVPDNQMEYAENEIEEQVDENELGEQQENENGEQQENEIPNEEQQEVENNIEEQQDAECDQAENVIKEEQDVENDQQEEENEAQDNENEAQEENQELDDAGEVPEAEFALDADNAYIGQEEGRCDFESYPSLSKDPLLCEEKPEPLEKHCCAESQVKKTKAQNIPPLIQKQTSNQGPYKFLLGRINPILKPLAPKIELDKKIGTLTLSERNEKIRKYNEKKKRRVFTKRIEYVGRKKEADNRFRYKGQFVSRDKAIALIGPAAINLSSNENLQDMLNKKSNCSIVLAANHIKIQNIQKLFAPDNNSTENKSVVEAFNGGSMSMNANQEEITRKINNKVQEGYATNQIGNIQESKKEDNTRVLYEMPNVKVPVFTLMKTQSEGILSSHQKYHIVFPQHKLN